MSDTPTYANLIIRLFSDSSRNRAAVIAHLIAHPADAVAVEAAVRDRLRSVAASERLIAADAVLRVYADVDGVLPTILSTLRAGGVAWGVGDMATLIRSLGSSVASVGGPNKWREFFFSGPSNAGPALLIGLADATLGTVHNCEALGPAIQHLLTDPQLCPVIGAALWRITWRVNRDWLAAIDPADEAMNFPGVRALGVEVLTEHLGRRPDLAGLVREMLAALAVADPDAGADAVARLVRLGSRGWGVLIPMLHPARAEEPFPVPDAIRETIFREAADRPAVLPLVHHHAHAAMMATTECTPLALEVFGVLQKLGPAAGMAIPDLLNLAVRVPSLGVFVGDVIRKVAGGFPNTGAAVVRTLDRIRMAPYFGSDHLNAFEGLAQALAELDPNMGPLLVENTALDPRVPDLLLQQPGWKDAPPETRRSHARILADALASPRPEVRLRAAELLRHYPDEMPAVWPALVALLAGSDEKAVIAVLPYFRHLAPVADAITPELIALFREKNPAYAARAIVALWRLGQMPAITTELREAVERDPEGGWGWGVLRGVVDRVFLAHSLLRDLSKLFAASPAAVAEKVNALVNPPEPEDEKRITQLVPHPGSLTAPATVDWNALHKLMENDGTPAALLHLALMCEYGSTGLAPQKIWMIKHHRELTRASLYEAKMAVERAMETLPRPGAPAADRRSAVRGFFASKTELPHEIVELLKHPAGWYRWAGLELADAWGLSVTEAKDLTEDRVWDTSPRVRERALRMLRG